MEWISVKDKLPERKKYDISDWVLCSTGHIQMEVCRYDYEEKRWHPKPLNFTHWMPLPKPPKK